MKAWITALLLCIAGVAAAQERTYYAAPTVTLGVALPPGISGYVTSYTCNGCTLGTVPDAVANIRYANLYGTCGGNMGGLSRPETCYVVSVKWVKPAGDAPRWHVQLKSTYYPDNPGYGGEIFPVYVPGASVYIDEPPGAKDYYNGPTKYVYDEAKMLGPQGCDACGDTDAFGNPISAATGNKFQTETDLAGPWNLRFVRYYNSLPSAPTHLLGLGWTHSYSSRVTLDASGTVAVVLRPGGRSLTYKLVGANWQSDADVFSRLIQIPGATAGTWSWQFQEVDARQVESFDQLGRLLRIDRADGEFALLTYNNGLTENNSNDLRLTEVSVQNQRTLKFFYDTAGRIVRLRRPDGLEIGYGYDAAGRLVTTSFPDGKSRQYRYDESGFNGGVSQPRALTGIIDERGIRYASFRYSAQGTAIGTEHAGATEAFAIIYGTDGSATIQMPSGATRTKPYLTPARSKRPWTIDDTAGGVTRHREYTYDASGNVDTFLDESGALTDFTYDARGLQTRRIEAANLPLLRRTVETSWDPQFAVPTGQRVLDAADLVVQQVNWTYNARGQVLSESRSDPASQLAPRVTSYSYCEQAGQSVPGDCPFVGALLRVDGPRTDVNDTSTLTYYYDDACSGSPASCQHRKGDLWKLSNGLGQTTTFLRYDEFGKPTEIADANGVRTSLEYGPRGWLLARKVRGDDDSTEVDDAVTRFEYLDTGEPRKITQPGGAFVQFSYDDARRLTDIQDSLGNKIHYVLDGSGNRVQEQTTDASGALRHALSRIYGNFNQLLSLADASSAPMDFSYSADGALDTVTDRLFRVHDQDTDALGRVTRSVANAGGGASDRAETRFKYDALDRILEVTDPKGLLTKYQYNAMGDQVSLDSPDTGVTAYRHDLAGNLTQQTDARGRITDFTFDALDRLTSQRVPTSAQNVYFDYDAYWYGVGADGQAQTDCQAGETYGVGRLAGIRDESGGTRYCYDRHGNVVRKVQSVVGGARLSVGASFDGAGRVIAMTYPSGAIVSYLRDGNGQIKSVDAIPKPGAAQATLVSNASYLPFGPLTRWTLGTAGRVVTKTYDGNYDIDKVGDSAASNPVSEDFSVDLGGRITGLLEQTAASTTAGRSYAYDGLDRLTSEKNGSKLVESFTYDATGNRLSKTVGNKTTTNAFPADSHRLSAVGNVTRSYDANGNTATIGSGNSAQAFVYDDRNRLRDFKVGTVLKASYRYNGKGEQVLRMDSTTPANSRQYVYDEAGHLLGEYTTAGVRIQEYVWLDDTLVGILSDHDGSTYQYVETDHLGTPRAVIHPIKNTIIWRWNLNDTTFGDHAPLGDPDNNGITYTLNLRYPGQRADPITGLNYNYFRDYDPATGRYVQSDPIGLSGGSSTYGYVSGSPLGGSDPLGLFLSSIQAACMQDPAFCVELMGSIARSRAAIARKECDSVVADYFNATGDLIGSFEKPALVATILSTVIRPAAVAAGRIESLKSSIHHICTNKNCLSAASGGPWTPRFQAIFDKAGMSLEHSLNKIAVPGHRGPHPEAYHQAIFDRLVAATGGLEGSAYKQALEAELRAIGREIEAPGSLLNRLLTGP